MGNANRFAYKTTAPNPIYIPTNRINTPYQTTKSINRDKVAQYVRDFKEGKPTPALVVGYDYDLHDGHHKLLAAIESGHTHVPCVVGGLNSTRVIAAERRYRALWKRENSDKGLYVKKLIIEAHKPNDSYENGPDFVVGALHSSEVWAQIWSIGMDWNCYWYMVDSKSDKPRLIAVSDGMIEEGKYKNNRMHVFSDVDKKWDGELAPHRIWQETVDKWVAYQLKKNSSTSGHRELGELDEKYRVFYRRGVEIEYAKRLVETILLFTGPSVSDIRAAQMGNSENFNSKEEERKYALMGSDLERSIEILPKWGKTGTLYRGVSFSNAILKKYLNGLYTGEDFSMLGVSSWSSGLDVAKKFSEGNYANKVIFVLKNGTRLGASIKDFSAFDEQEEVLISGKARFVVTSFKKSGEYSMIGLSELLAKRISLTNDLKGEEKAIKDYGERIK